MTLKKDLPNDRQLAMLDRCVFGSHRYTAKDQNTVRALVHTSFKRQQDGAPE